MTRVLLRAPHDERRRRPAPHAERACAAARSSARVPLAVGPAPRSGAGSAAGRGRR
ncbi:MAG: hypothetical protein MZV64_13945 [Ignavibacteriales bacterium]|nr:hypothetical protein [Ignavibacteriales bacterium]